MESTNRISSGATGLFHIRSACPLVSTLTFFPSFLIYLATCRQLGEPEPSAHRQPQEYDFGITFRVPDFFYDLIRVGFLIQTTGYIQRFSNCFVCKKEQSYLVASVGDIYIELSAQS
jgi:hypothetical protein